MNKRRKMLKGLAATSLLSGAGLTGLTGLIGEALANGNKPLRAGMQKVTGNVTVNGKPAQPGMAVGAGDTIITGAGGEAIYVIGQDAYLQREKSTVSFAAGVAGAAVGVMRVLTGKILSVFGKGDKKLETPTATIGIRGTGCYIEAEENRVYFCLCYGEAEVSPAANPNHVERIKTKHHDHPIYINKGSSMPAMVDASVINHDDIELKLLENLVGRWPPFYEGSRY
jgi:hypothetical protein